VEDDIAVEYFTDLQEAEKWIASWAKLDARNWKFEIRDSEFHPWTSNLIFNIFIECGALF
jgi:hypothetical protein